MTRADLEAAAKEKYPERILVLADGYFDDGERERAAYIRGRLDQAEADKRIARSMIENEADGYYGQACYEIADAIRKGVK